MYWLDKLKWWKKSRGLELQLIIHNPAGLDKRYIKLNCGDTLNVVDDSSPQAALSIVLLEEVGLVVHVYTDRVRLSLKEEK